MELYTFLRQLADSWALLAMFLFFIGIVIWAFRPGSKRIHEDTANIPFRYEDAPAAAHSGNQTPCEEHGSAPSREDAK